MDTAPHPGDSVIVDEGETLRRRKRWPFPSLPQIIVHRIEPPDRVTILRIWHAARDRG